MPVSVENRIKKMIAEQLGVNQSEVVDQADIFDHLGADSLDSIELIMALEEEFEIEIADELVENVRTVKQTVELVISLIKN